MVPAVSLTKMPLTANGKIDHQALPAPDRVRPNQAAFYTPPRTDVEQQMVRAWQEVLNLDKVGIHDNFFDLGGNSLLLLRAYNRLEHLFNQDEMGIEFFKYPTIASLAYYLRNNKTAEQPDYSQIQARIGHQRAAIRRQALRSKAQRGQGALGR